MLTIAASTEQRALCKVCIVCSIGQHALILGHQLTHVRGLRYYQRIESAAKTVSWSAVVSVSVQQLEVKFFFNEAASVCLAEVHAKNHLAQLVVDQNQEEERPRGKPPRPSTTPTILINKAVTFQIY